MIVEKGNILAFISVKRSMTINTIASQNFYIFILCPMILSLSVTAEQTHTTMLFPTGFNPEVVLKGLMGFPVPSSNKSCIWPLLGCALIRLWGQIVRELPPDIRPVWILIASLLSLLLFGNQPVLESTKVNCFFYRIFMLWYLFLDRLNLSSFLLDV